MIFLVSSVDECYFPFDAVINKTFTTSVCVFIDVVFLFSWVNIKSGIVEL